VNIKRLPTILALRRGQKSEGAIVVATDARRLDLRLDLETGWGAIVIAADARRFDLGLHLETAVRLGIHS